MLREERGESPTVEEYVRRFPEHADEIRLHFEIHAALQTSDRSLPSLVPVVNKPPPLRGYEVLEVLGRGGMGVVYKARQTALNRLVALKMTAAGIDAEEEELSRFRREAQAIACLKHPHIVQIHEVGEDEGRLFLSLEYVDGGALARRLDGTPWPAQDAAQLVETLARAMHYAHQQGVVHRDLKPANILLAPNPKSEIQKPKPTRSSKEANPQQAPWRIWAFRMSDFGLWISSPRSPISAWPSC
jgi:serine/threonine protein kinase